jgi:hypothetical protein
MKTNRKNVFYIFLLLAVVITSCGNKSKSGTTTGEEILGVKSEQNASKEKKLPFERGSYVEETNTMGIELKKTVYFDKWGDWTASETKFEMEIMKGHSHKSHKLEIVKGSTHWDLDLIERTGTTYETPVLPAGIAAAIGAAMGGKMAEGTEIKELGEENYLGYECKKTQVKSVGTEMGMEMEMIILAYGNLTMKTEGKMGQMNISNKITSIDLSAPPKSIFEVPADIEVTKN